MKLARLFALILLPFSAAAQTTTVTANLRDVGVVNLTPGTPASITFELQNFQNAIPRVISTNAVIGQVAKAYVPDTSGQVSGTVYDNTYITPAGTFYKVCVAAQGYTTVCDTYTITGSSWNLSNATPNTTTPVVPAPTGDGTYARLDGGNTPFTGPLQIPHARFTANAAGAASALDVGYDAVTATGSYNANNQGASSYSGAWNCVNVTPVTVNANTTNDQAVMSCTVPAGTLNRVGRTLRIHATVGWSTPASSTTNFQIAAKLCWASDCGSGQVLLLARISSANLPTWQVSGQIANYDLYSTTQTAGVNATFEAHGNMVIEQIPNFLNAQTDTNVAPVGTIDSTVQLYLKMYVAFSSASSSNSAIQRQLILETVN